MTLILCFLIAGGSFPWNLSLADSDHLLPELDALFKLPIHPLAHAEWSDTLTKVTDACRMRSRMPSRM